MGSLDPVNLGVFPTLNDCCIDSDITCTAQELSRELLDRAISYSSGNGLDITALLRTAWSIVLQRYVESDTLCFAFGIKDESLPARDLKSSVLRTCQVLLDLEESVGDLWKRQQTIPDLDQAYHRQINYNTGIFISNCPPGVDATGLFAEFEALHPDGAHCQVLLALEGVLPDSPQRLVLLAKPSILSAKQVRNVASTIAQVISEILLDPRQTVSELNLFSAQNARDVLEWNSRACQQLTDSPIVEAIRKRSCAQPSCVAIDSWDGQLTYAALESITSKLAVHLYKLGVGPDVLVPLLFERSIWTVIAQLAVLKAGGAFVPLEPANPDARLEYIVKCTKARLILTSEACTTRAASLAGRVVTLSRSSITSICQGLDNDCIGLLPPIIDLGKPAYVLFTSGSTGQPKGCVVENRGLAQLSWQASYVDIRPTSRVLQFAPYSFMMSVLETYMCLSTGATLCIPSDDSRVNNLPGVMETMKISWACMTPSLLRRLDADHPPPTLRTIGIGGEPMGEHEYKAWVTKVGLFFGYGVTECAGFLSVSLLKEGQVDWRALPPSPTVRLWLLDPTNHDRLAPVGAVAELAIEGIGVAREYLDNQDATSAAFIQDPTWRRTMGPPVGGPIRMYKTGDLWRYNGEGGIRHVGRKGTQVKIQGKRLDLEEVEFQMRQSCPESTRVVAEAASPAAASSNDPLLIAFLHSPDYLTGEPQAALTTSSSSSSSLLAAQSSETFRKDVSALQTNLLAVLPGHMLPSIYLPLKLVPFTITGKVDRRALREMVQRFTREELEAYQSAPVELVPPTTPVERDLHGFFVQVLGLDGTRFGIHHSFIRLGGDSMAAMRLVTLCRAKYYPLTVADILERQNISQLTRFLTQNSIKIIPGHAPDDDDVVLSEPQSLKDTTVYFESIKSELAEIQILDAADVEDACCCSPVQQGILLSHARNPHYYQAKVVWEVVSCASGYGSSIDVELLQTAWQKLCALHPMLRTVFIEAATATQETLAVQVTLRHRTRRVEVRSCSESEVLSLGDVHRPSMPRRGLAWLPELSIYRTMDGRVYCVLDIHHALMDAMSLHIITRDLARLYVRNRQNDNGNNDKLLRQTNCAYTDYVRHLARMPKEPTLAFWEHNLAGIENCIFPKLNWKLNNLEPSCLRSMKVDLGTQPDWYYRFCREAGLTLANVFKLAWALVLRTFTGSNSVCFGYMTLGRDIPVDGVEEAVGPFINTLPCFLELDPRASLLQTAEKVQSEFIRALPHQHVSLAEIHKALAVRNESLFNTSMTFVPHLDLQNQEPAAAPVSLKLVDMQGPTEYDIIIEVNSQHSSLECSVKYWDHFLSKDQASHLASALRVALDQIVGSPQHTVSEVELFSPQDERKLAEWNRDAPLAAKEDCIHDLFQQCCRSQPDALAVCSWDGTLTYRELDLESSILAHHLHAAGVRPETFVPICLERSRWTLIAVLAVIKAGGAFCLLDPSHPTTRLAEICQALNAPIILTSEPHVHRTAQLGVPTTSMVVGDTLLQRDPKQQQLEPETLSSGVTPSNALYAIFTSGSTGKPKGVVLEHRCFCPAALSCPGPLDMRPLDRTLHFCSYAFDVSVIEILVPLIVGACICIPSEEDRMNNLPRIMTDLQVTWAVLTPTVARLLQPNAVPTLRTLVLAGEAVLASSFEGWSPRTTLISAYSPAECTPLGLAAAVEESRPNFLGRGFASHATWIVDPQDCQKLVPIGAVGELVIEGSVVGRSYLHDPDRSLPDSPFISPPSWLARFRRSTISERHLYRTGDLVQYASDGQVRFVGRKDFQVKVRGQRLELAEVEHHIERLLPWASSVVAETVVLDGEKDRRAIIVAFISSATFGDEVTAEASIAGGEATAITAESSSPQLGPIDEEFQAHIAKMSLILRDKLPSYMLPTIFLPLSRVPLTRSGKINRRQLRHLVATMPRETLEGSQLGQRQMPATESEYWLQALFAEVLHLPIEKVWADSHFFRLGGDSVAAMQLVASARARHHLAMTVADIFQHPQLCELASVVSICVNGPSATVIPSPFSLLPEGQTERILGEATKQCRLPSESIEDIYPCTPIQGGLMALSVQRPQAYIMQQAYTLQHGVDIDRLKCAWNKVAEAHPILRTRIIQATGTGSFYQVLVAAVDRPPASSWMHNKAGDETSLGLGTPLLCLSWTPPSGLVVTIHHALYDAWSFPLLLQEVERAYQGLSLQPQPFNTFVAHVLKSIDSGATFWASELENVQTVEFPALPSMNYIPDAQEMVVKTLPLVARASNQDAITLASKIKLAWALTTFCYTNTRDTICGIVNYGRGAPVVGIERILGPTIATTPLRVRIDPAQKVRDALHEIQRRGFEQTTHEHIGLQNIGQLSDSAAVACQFNTLLVVQSKQSASQASWFQGQQNMSDVGAFSSYALTLVCEPRSSGSMIDVTAVFDSKVLPPLQVQRILSQFAHLLAQVQTVPDHLSISGLQMLNPRDWAELKSWNPYPSAVGSSSRCVHEAIQQQSQLRPDARAIHSWDGYLTYQELEYYSDRLSRQLRTRGRFGPDYFVGLYFEKSRWAVVAQIAVLKAGGAFIMLEPSYPMNRLQEICQTLDLSLIIASQQHRHEATVHLRRPVVVADEISIARPICLDDSRNIKAREGSDRTVSSVTDAMYAIATSGTTGKPKVVVTDHGPFMASAMPLIEKCALGPDSRVLQFAGYSFDNMIADHFFTLLAGGCICIPSAFERENCLSKAITDMEVNVAMLTSSVIQLLSPEKAPTLRTLLQGGEPMQQAIIDRWASTGVRLMNWYGPSECSICCCINTSVTHSTSPNNIGQSTGGVCWIVDPEDPERPVPIGGEGELIVEGPILGRGYVNAPDKTAAAFIAQPRWLNDLRGLDGLDGGARVYRTGDIARHGPDGSIYYLRRKDSQAKLRGQRLELTEVEYHVQKHFPEALQTVVEVTALASDDERSTVLVALVRTSQASQSMTSGQDDETTKMKGHKPEILLPATPQFLENVQTAKTRLQEQVPSYMVPTLFIPVSWIPWNVNGKVDRPLLRQLLTSLSRHELTHYSPRQRADPTTDLEREMQAIWARVLNLPRVGDVGIHDSFFRIGGDSITSMQLVAQCSEAGIPVTVKEVLKHQTIAKLAAEVSKNIALVSPDRLSQQKEKTEEEEEVDGAVCELSPVQQMFFDFIPQGHNHFNQSFFLRLEKQLDPRTISEAVRVIVQTHGILRARFKRSQVGDHRLWTQRVVTDYLEGSSHRFQHHVVQTRRQMEEICVISQGSLNIQHGPMLIVNLFDHSIDRKQYLFMVAHHLVIDLVSWRIILSDLEELLRSKKAPSAPPTSFLTWCRLQAQYTAHNNSEVRKVPSLLATGAITSQTPMGMHILAVSVSIRRPPTSY
ncbi:hypothetical protein ASPZODRAFT_1627112 [Penicilliopsis zonata CBS 506.65]|uniref:Carrier domain-containing protein n=1 Tax=Penicilliopsis zonata CBS 506.65 TaxID=1073090 RepID=A0A1L9SN02_9EURO|nr:hypothetical protein ASPZODRAFT_1627112 [Penicilliopsis zonata CBS 506.65]OJJ48580.1 hypothetical protein ASPZODRAFT_1627112 [Penicilliopsis zonata CBS 506.65]